jgi:hypothetical protein
MNNVALTNLNALLQREYSHELRNYTVHKKMANMICDLGYLVADNPVSSSHSKYHRLIKQTD